MVYTTRTIQLKPVMMTGPDVLAVQQRLKILGFYSGQLDGLFGKQSDMALRQFQKSRNLKTDGQVGPDTWLFLGIDRSDFDFGQESMTSSRIYIHLNTRILNLVHNGQIDTYPVAIGKTSTPTPVGEWTIVQKLVDPGGPFGVRWMRLSIPWGGYGIHGTNNPASIGKAVSHGCVRMYNEDVIQVYDIVPLGTPVSISGTTKKARTMKMGSHGSDVADVQNMLGDLGYYSGLVDGYFGKATRKAVIKFQKSTGLNPNGIVDLQTYKSLQTAHDFALTN